MKTRLMAVLLSVVCAACSRKVSGPVPEVSGVDPDLVCTDQLVTDVTLSGKGFSPLVSDTLTKTPLLNLPQIELTAEQSLDGAALSGTTAIPDDPTAPDASHAKWVSQQEMHFEIFPGLSLSPGVYGVRVTNRNGNSGAKQNVLLAVPPPTLTSVVPDLVCRDADVTVTLNGDYFLLVGSAVPSVSVGDVTLTPTASADCRVLPGPGGVQACRQLTIALTAGQFAAGEYPVSVTNPAPAACHSSEARTLVVAPPPVIDTVTPDITTAAAAPATLTLSGSGFLSVDGVLPEVTAGGVALTNVALSNCEAVQGTTLTAQTCTTLTAIVPQGTAPGATEVLVRNPMPADCLSAPKPVFLAPAPLLTRLEPPGLCTAGGPTGTLAVAVTGEHFFSVGTAVPSVSVGGTSFVATPRAASCTAIDGFSQPILECTTLDFSLDTSAYPVGSYDTVVHNPAPVAADSAALPFVVADPPSLTSVTPRRVCASGGTLSLAGTGFTASMLVSLGSTSAATVNTTSGTAATATFGNDLVVGGPYDVTVNTGAGACSATLPAEVTVTNGPLVYFVDPPVMFNGISIQATIYASGFISDGLAVSIRPSGGTAQALPVTWDPAKPNRVQVTVPAGLAPGAYDVILADADTVACPGTLLNAFQVVDATTLQLTAIDPPFGSTLDDTAVTISADGGLSGLPRFYLTSSTTDGGVATPLESVALLSGSRATAVVPSGLAVATYDLVAVTPSGDVGLLPQSFTVIADPVPVIDTVKPAQLVTQAAQQFTVTGQDFRSQTVSLRCADTLGALTVVTNTTLSNTSATSTTVTFDGSALSNGSVCVVRLTNSDGSYADFSSIVMTNPAGNLTAWKPGPALNVGRRALSVQAGFVTRAAQFLYAIGGESGTTPAPIDSVETEPLDIYGNPSPFFVQQEHLVTPRAYAGGKRVGRWLYVAGGRSATGTLLDTVERAFLLDPKDRVQIADLDFQVVESGGVAPGTYSYRVAAVMDTNDAFNPGGENLPSDPFPVQVPTVSGHTVNVKVLWNPTPGAVAYRVYRTEQAGGVFGTEKLLATVPASQPSYVDDGTVTPTGSAPLPLGSTGVWKTVATLPEARQGAGAAIAQDLTDATKTWFYLIGGRDASGDLASVVKFSITTAADGSQTVDTPSANAFSLPTTGSSTARWLLTAYTADAVSAPRVGASTYVYAVGGQSGTATSSVSQSAVLGLTGDIGPFVAESNLTPARAGFVGAIANNTMFAFTGLGGAPDASSSSTAVSLTPPATGNWNNATASLSVSRFLAGGTLHGAHIYAIGGQTPVDAATTSTEQIIW